MRFGYFDDKNREYVITTPKTPYPWINYLGSENFFALVSHRAGGYCFYRDARLRRLMRYRYNNVPDRRRRPLLLHQRRRRGLEPELRADQHGARRVRVPPRPRLHAHHRRAQGRARVAADASCRTGHTAEVHQLTLKNTTSAREEPQGVLVHRVVPVERLRRHDQLPAQLLDRRGRDRARRRDAVPQDRIPRAARPLRVLQRERATSPASTPTARRSSACTTSCGEPQVPAKGQSSNSRGQRLVSRSRRTAWTSSSRPARRRRSCSRSATSRCRATRSGRSRASSTRSRAHELIAKFSTAGAGRRGDEGAGRPLVEAALELLDRVGRREAEPHGQHLEPVPVHGDVQHVALAPRTSRPASAAAWASATRTRTCSGFVHLVPERARERIIDIASTQFPDGSAYHQYQPLTKRGNNDVGSGFNDDPLWLIFGVAAYITRDRRLRASSTSRCRSTTTRRRRRRCSSTSSARSTTCSTTWGRTGCR